nr:hypothetical protein P5668_19915 [Bacillus subtilis]
MVDSYKKQGVSDLDGRTVESDVEALMNVNRDNEALNSEAVKQGYQAKNTCFLLILRQPDQHRYQVKADIDLLTSGAAFDMPEWLASWEEATTGAYRMKRGFGTHAEMLQGETLDRNAEILLEFLNTQTVTVS